MGKDVNNVKVILFFSVLNDYLIEKIKIPKNKFRL